MYFTVNEYDKPDGIEGHIGTIEANTIEELNSKLQLAMNEHFDRDVIVKTIFESLDDLKYGKDSEIELSTDDVQWINNAYISETWMY